MRIDDTVVVHSIDRLARNLDDLRRIVQQLTQRGVRIEFVKEGSPQNSEKSYANEFQPCVVAGR